MIETINLIEPRANNYWKKCEHEEGGGVKFELSNILGGDWIVLSITIYSQINVNTGDIKADFKFPTGNPGVLLKRGTENGTENGMKRKTKWKLRRKTNIVIALIQMLTNENDLK